MSRIVLKTLWEKSYLTPISLFPTMRHEENFLDLNNLPDEFSKDVNKQALEEGSSSSGQRKKKGGKEGKDESGKVYECRFCSLKFCKSQALGGHMNRHRQERETETLNQARQLVYRNDTLTPPGISPFGYHTADPTMYRSVYSSPMLYPGSSSTNMVPPLPMPPLPPPPPYPYSSNQYSPHNHMNDYYLSQSFRGSRSISPNPNLPTTTVNYMPDGPVEASYTCVGAPIGQTGFPSRGSATVRAPLESPQGRDGDTSRQSLRFPINGFQDHHSL
ncbi:Zinc finger protein JAGGED [Cardamine amara subsp. amara]|uniref:Zinc finger protein JAGGED n=1 Tax=Cardamine amara subsp. amara TaxID=228776 RepID=A0ABD1C1F4_CARAN